jgi:hypothetical protein
LIFSKPFFETFLILKRIQPDIIIDEHNSASCKVPVIFVRFTTKEDWTFTVDLKIWCYICWQWIQHRFCAHRRSKPEPPSRERVAIPTILSRPLKNIQLFILILSHASIMKLDLLSYFSFSSPYVTKFHKERDKKKGENLFWLVFVSWFEQSYV